MLLCVAPILLMGLCAVAAGDGGVEVALGAEAGPWEGSVPGIQLQLREEKRGKSSQFFGLMGKRVGGMSSVQLVRAAGCQQGHGAPGLLDRTGPDTEELFPDQEEDQGPE